jgi:hypothetical protein
MTALEELEAMLAEPIPPELIRRPRYPEPTGDRVGLANLEHETFQVLERYDDGVWRPRGPSIIGRSPWSAACEAGALLVFDMIGRGPVESATEGRATGWEVPPPRDRAVTLSHRWARYGMGAAGMGSADGEMYSER